MLLLASAGPTSAVTAPPPQMALFDSADRNACSVRRSSTNTALQALLLMNDTQHVEAARHLATRVLNSAESDNDRLAHLYRYTLARTPRPAEAQVLLKGLTHYRNIYAADQAGAQALIALGASPAPESLAADELAAWTMIANTVLNLDETVTRP